MLALVVSAFGGLKLIYRIGIILGFVAVVGGAYASWRNSIYNSGVQDALRGVAAEDQKLIDGAIAYRSELKKCQTLGKAWDQTTGRCQ